MEFNRRLDGGNDGRVLIDIHTFWFEVFNIFNECKPATYKCKKRLRKIQGRVIETQIDYFNRRKILKITTINQLNCGRATLEFQ